MKLPLGGSGPDRAGMSFHEFSSSLAFLRINLGMATNLDVGGWKQTL